MLANRFFELRFQIRQSIEKLVAARTFYLWLCSMICKWISCKPGESMWKHYNSIYSEQEHLHACAVIDKEKKRNPFNLWKCNELTLSHTAIYTLQYWSRKTFWTGIKKIIHQTIWGLFGKRFWKTTSMHKKITRKLLHGCF